VAPVVDPAACPPDTAAMPVPDQALPLPVDPASAGRPVREKPQHVRTSIGMAALIGGGVTQFFGSDATDRVQTGASYTARFELGTRTHLGAEFAYVGTTQQLRGFTGNEGLLMSNGTEALARWNILTGPVQPYAGAGIGWKNYRLRNIDAPVADIQGSADFAHVPAIAGVAFRAGGFVFDTRFTVAAPISPTLIERSRLVSWDASGRVGFEF
jgi:hypothetical protein